MSKSRIAAVCSFLVPGSGLVYLGKWVWGVTNLALATGAVLLLSSSPTISEHIHYVFLAIAAGSAGLAHAAATECEDETQAIN